MVKSIIRFILVILLAGASKSLPQITAQDRPAYTYQQMESILIKQNSALEAARQRIEAATHILQATGPKYWPRLNFYYRYFPNGVSFQEGEIATKNWFNARFTFDLVKFFKVRALRKKEQQAAVELAEIALQKLEYEALFAFRKLYIETLHHKIQAHYAARVCSTSEKIRALRRVQFNNREALKVHILAAEIDYRENEGNLNQHQLAYEMGMKQIGLALKIPSDSFELKENFFIPFIPDENSLLQKALSNHVLNRESALYIEKELLRSRAAAADELSLEPYLGYRMRELRQGAVEAGPEVGVRFGLGLGYFSQKHHQQKYAEATRKAIRLEEEGARQEFIHTLKTTYNQLHSLKVMVQQKNEQHQLNMESMRIEEAIAEQGIEGIDSTPLHVLELEAENYKLQKQAMEYRTEYMGTYFEMMHLSGISWPDVLQFRNQKAQPKSEEKIKALWVWDSPSLLIDANSSDALVVLCNKQKFNKVYLSLPGELENKLFKNARFIRLLANLWKNKIKVAALLGDPHWIFPQNRKKLLQKVNDIIRFNERYAPVSLFSSLHLDIEPHTLAAWVSRKSLYMQLFIQTLSAVNEEMAAWKSGMPLEIDLPLLVNKFDRSVLDQIVSECDEITIMAYNRRNARKIRDDSVKLLQAIRAGNKKYIIGLNSKDFHNLSELDERIIALKNIFSDDPGNRGFAIHNFQTFYNFIETR
ncbi:MAG: hypothetical protein DWQ05_16630 [Calditrichaeota bacterium]|nr:MAG: hypothetical protein DWQ05_16630 [Calditrichota bacterium]